MADETGAPDERLVELTHQMFDLTRTGDADRLLAYVEASATHAFPDGAGQLTVSEPRTPRLPGPTASG